LEKRPALDNVIGIFTDQVVSHWWGG